MSQFTRALARQIVMSSSFVETMTELMSVEIERQLQGMAGGDRLYIPKTSSSEDKKERNRLIRARFTGNNHAELCKSFNLRRSQLYAVLKAKG